MTKTATVSKKSVKEKLSKAKDKMITKIDNAKEEYKQTKKDLRQARKQGYNSGLNDFKVLPKRKGAVHNEKKGYARALSDSQKADKYNKRIGR